MNILQNPLERKSEHCFGPHKQLIFFINRKKIVRKEKGKKVSLINSQVFILKQILNEIRESSCVTGTGEATGKYDAA